jgi:membrane protease subunit (stomatin/prohibitin family)
MAILDLVEWADPSPTEIVHRIPEQGSGEFRLGSQLVVRENQTAVFYHNGKAADTFGPGRFTLMTENIPILASLIGIPFGGKTPFRTEMYFVSLRNFLDLKWGTAQPIALRDPDLGLARLRAFGTFAMTVDDPSLFVNKIVGGQGLYATDDIIGYLRGMVTSRFSDILGTLGLGLFDLPSNYDEIGAALAAGLRDEFLALGLALKAMYVTNISTTEETQKAIDERASMGAIGNMDAYMKFKAARAIESSAAAGGGEGGSAVALGMGLGAGAGLGGVMAQMMGQAMQPGQSAPAAAGTPAGAAAPQATLDQVFAALNTLVGRQLAVPAADRAEIGTALGGLQQSLAAAAPSLDEIKTQRAAITSRWPWLAPELEAAFREPAVAAALARAASAFTGG